MGSMVADGGIDCYSSGFLEREPDRAVVVWVCAGGIVVSRPVLLSGGDSDGTARLAGLAHRVGKRPTRNTRSAQGRRICRTLKEKKTQPRRHGNTEARSIKYAFILEVDTFVGCDEINVTRASRPCVRTRPSRTA